MCVFGCSCMWLLSDESDWWWGMERIRNTLGCEWGVSRRVTLAQNTAASHIITLITLMRTTLRATKRLDSWRLALEHKHKDPHIHSIPHAGFWKGAVFQTIFFLKSEPEISTRKPTATLQMPQFTTTTSLLQEEIDLTCSFPQEKKMYSMHCGTRIDASNLIKLH